jgi:hypothetical protein
VAVLLRLALLPYPSQFTRHRSGKAPEIAQFTQSDKNAHPDSAFQFIPPFPRTISFLGFEITQVALINGVLYRE